MACNNCVLESGWASTAGLRPENEDRVAEFDSPFGRVFLLADGMGGHRGGSVASSLAASRMPELMASCPSWLPAQDALEHSVQSLNQIILEESRNGGEGERSMGSTLVVLLVRATPDGLLAIGGHVGDSRLYLVRESRLFCQTRDHTIVQRMLDAGTLTEEQASVHPQAGMLTRALGREPFAVDWTSWMLLQPGDTFLLCSDGLSAYVAGDAIREILASADGLDAMAHGLVAAALEAGSDDNISALLVRVR